MAFDTTYQGYHLPTVGQPNWGDEIVAAWKDLDSDVRGITASGIVKDVGEFGDITTTSLASGSLAMDTVHNARVVTNGSDLQSAVDNYKRVSIAGNIDVSASSPITIGDDRTLFGYGTIGGDNVSITGSDLINDSTAGPTIHADGNNVRLFGLGIENSHTDGIGVRFSGYSAQASHCDIEANVNAILCNGPDSTTTPTEPRINFNRLTASGQAEIGSIGVYIENQFDSKITNNIVAGFETAIQLDTNSAYIGGNHTYKYPSDSTLVGIRSGASDHRIVNNRFEGTIEDKGIIIESYEKTLVMNNLVQMNNTDTDGIYVGDIGGWLTRSIITGNMLQIQGSGGSDLGQGMNMDNVTTFNNSCLSDNVVDGWAEYGTTMLREAAGAGLSPDPSHFFAGQMILNSDDNTVWTKLPDTTMVQVA